MTARDPICRQCATQEHGDYVPEECTCSERRTPVGPQEAVAVKALKRIAEQRLTDDMTDEQRSNADYEFGYNEIVRRAREALASKKDPFDGQK